MRTLIKLSALCLATCSTALFCGNIANAADQNSYRAGTPYLKTVATHFSQCEQQCRGDAACRSWNFVRPNAGAASGICEFNSRMATPVSSSVSMSGAIRTSVDPLMSHAVAANNKSNTIRVGTPTVVRRPAQPQIRQGQGQGQKTIVKRQPIPLQRAPQQTNHVRPIAPKTDNRTPRIYGSVQQTGQPTAKSPVVKQTEPQQLTPQQAYYRQQYLAQKQYQVDMQRQQQIWQQQNAQRIPQSMMHRGPALQMQAPQTQVQRPMPTPRPTQQVQRPMPQQGLQTPTRAPMQNRAPQQRPQSLYGSLHDDLTQNMTTVPRPQTAPDRMNNPDAPMSTSRAVPTTPVQTAPMSDMVMPNLAGSGLAGG